MSIVIIKSKTMNITGNKEVLRECSANYTAAKYSLNEAVSKHLKSDVARFALKVLMMEEPTKYLEAIVRNEINSQGKENVNQ